MSILSRNRNRILTIAFIGLFLIFTNWANDAIDPYLVRILNFWGIYIIFSSTFQLVYGYTGLLTLGHAGLVAIGGYTVGVLTLDPTVKQVSYLLVPPHSLIAQACWPFVPALLLGGVFTAIIGFLVAAPAVRLGGDYLAMVTLGFAEIIRLIIINVPSLANGAMGLRGIPLSVTLPGTWAAAIIVVFILARLEKGTYGRAFKAVCEDEIASEALGINLYRHKMLAFVISAFFIGIGGGLMASVLGTIDPNTFRLPLTTAAITIVVLGGIRSLTGCVIASGIYTIFSELFRAVESKQEIFGITFPGIPGMRVEVFGVLLLLLILFMRNGMFGSREFSWDWLAQKGKRLLGKGGAAAGRDGRGIQ